ncbi:hypothetical protein RA2_00836 [Roseovarius sp. A-2]|nr:hypothetical protein RA2_00836 [Roseovarius sp. A-2]
MSQPFLQVARYRCGTWKILKVSVISIQPLPLRMTIFASYAMVWLFDAFQDHLCQPLGKLIQPRHFAFKTFFRLPSLVSFLKKAVSKVYMKWPCGNLILLELRFRRCSRSGRCVKWRIRINLPKNFKRLKLTGRKLRLCSDRFRSALRVDGRNEFYAKSHDVNFIVGKASPYIESSPSTRLLRNSSCALASRFLCPVP